MVRDSMDSFKSLWQERAAQRRSKSDWATTEVLSRPNNGRNERKEVDEEVLTPGSIIKVAIGERVPHVYVTISGNMRVPAGSRSAWQQKLCKVLVDVCSPDMSTKINPSAIKETPNHLSYLQLEVHGNHTFVGNALEWREIGFAVEIIGPQMNLSKSTLQSTCRCMPKDFGVVSVQDRFHANCTISLIMSNTRAVEAVRAGAVQWPG